MISSSIFNCAELQPVSLASLSFSFPQQWAGLQASFSLPVVLCSVWFPPFQWAGEVLSHHDLELAPLLTNADQSSCVSAHPCIFFGEMSVQHLAQFFIVFLGGVEL
jgi:hypothetical protein